MSILDWCERIQESWVSRTISESTWGYPIAGALHVLVVAVFGVMVLLPHLRVLGFAETRRTRLAGLTLTVVTGALVFASGAAHYYESTAFRIKMLLLVLLAANAIVTPRGGPGKIQSAFALLLWLGVIFASRGIAFF